MLKNLLFNIYFIFTVVILLTVAFLEIFRVLDRRSRILIIIVLALFLIFSYFFFALVIRHFLIFGLALFIATCLVLVYLALGIILPRSEVWGNVFWHGAEDEKEVALTFDDGPSPANTPQILAILAGYKIKATFFMVGKNIRRYRQLAKQVSAEGHSIGNHSYSHPVLISERKGQIRREVMLTDKIIRQVTGKIPIIFRPPHGFKDPRVFNIVRELRYIFVSWSNMPEDWKELGAEKIAERVMERAEPGDIILLHDGEGSKENADRSETIKALPMIIEGLSAKGYAFKTIPQMLGETEWILELIRRWELQIPRS
jgi:peptidoglycan/xylan/chitin deacetylase (PgdA/CDA1 family)